MVDRAARSIRARSNRRGWQAWLLPVACCVLAVGCNSGRQLQRDLYVRELRLQEDEIYRLEDCIEEYQAILRRLRRENHELLSATAHPGSSHVDKKPAVSEKSLLDSPEWSPNRPSAAQSPPPPPREVAPPLEDAPEVELPEIDAGEPTEAPPFNGAALGEDTPADAPPAVELPTTPPPGVSPPLDSLPQPEPITPPAPTDSSPPASPDSAPPFEALPLSAQLPDTVGAAPTRRISRSTGGLATAQLTIQPGPREPTGESTLSVRVQPLTADDDSTRFRGRVSLLLRDPTERRHQAELARWDYTAEEVTDSWIDDADGPALDLVLVLPVGTPMDESLELWVALVDGQGHTTYASTRLEDDQPQEFAPPADATPLGNQPLTTTPTPDEPVEGWSQTPTRNTPLPRDWRRSTTSRHTGSEVRLAGFDEPQAEDDSPP